jgi:hypothetical protein
MEHDVEEITTLDILVPPEQDTVAIRVSLFYWNTYSRKNAPTEHDTAKVKRFQLNRYCYSRKCPTEFDN